MKESFAKHVLFQATLVAQFFRSSSLANSVLENEIQINNIVATRWSSYYDAIYSILHLKVAFIRILEHNSDAISNNEPIKESIIQLESQDSTLADCFVYLIKLAATIYQIPQDQHTTFILGFRRDQYKKISRYADNLRKAFGNKETSCRQLLGQLASYKENELPFNKLFEPNCQTPQTCRSISKDSLILHNTCQRRNFLYQSGSYFRRCIGHKDEIGELDDDNSDEDELLDLEESFDLNHEIFREEDHNNNIESDLEDEVVEEQPNYNYNVNSLVDQ
ncbi:17140_t:CDS:2, partial [Gigaspora margarita]